MNSATKIAKFAGKEWGKKARKNEAKNLRGSIRSAQLRDQKENG